MRYERVCLESFGYCLPSEIWSSDEIEQRLEPLYDRLRLPAGRLELMTGIAQRRRVAIRNTAQRQEHHQRPIGAGSGGV